MASRLARRVSGASQTLSCGLATAGGDGPLSRASSSLPGVLSSAVGVRSGAGDGDGPLGLERNARPQPGSCQRGQPGLTNIADGQASRTRLWPGLLPVEARDSYNLRCAAAPSVAGSVGPRSWPTEGIHSDAAFPLRGSVLGACCENIRGYPEAVPGTQSTSWLISPTQLQRWLSAKPALASCAWAAAPCLRLVRPCGSLPASKDVLTSAMSWVPHIRLVSSFAGLPRSATHSSSSSSGGGGLLLLNELKPSPGSTHRSKRLGRGIGSGKGKTAGRGHKGQKSRSGRKPKIGFEGGQTPLRLRLPKRGFHNPFSLDFQVVNLKDVIAKIDSGIIHPQSLITMKTLKDAGLGGKAMRDGIKLLARGAETVEMPLHFEVSRVSEAAKNAVLAAGGSVTRVHYNKLGLRALLKPEWFAKQGRLLPRPARPPPRILRLGLVDSVGRIPAPTDR